MPAIRRELASNSRRRSGPAKRVPKTMRALAAVSSRVEAASEDVDGDCLVRSSAGSAN